MELDHNPTIHQQAKTGSQPEEDTHLRNIIQAFHIRKDIYQRLQSLLTSFRQSITRSSLQQKR
jgi:hypothetical protein